MYTDLSKLQNYYLCFASFSFAGAVLISLLEVVLGSDFLFVRKTTEIFLGINSLCVLYFLLARNFDTKLIWWALVTFFTTLILEIIRANIGLVFGEYEYGSVVALKVLGVSLLVGILWVLIILASIRLAKKTQTNLLTQFFLAGLVTVTADIIIEPITIHLDYWRWPNDTVPLQNYLTWYIITVVFATFYKIFKIWIDSNLMKHFFFLKINFLSFLNLINSCNLNSIICTKLVFVGHTEQAKQL